MTDDLLGLDDVDTPRRRRLPRGSGLIATLTVIVLLAGIGLAGGRSIGRLLGRDSPDYSGQGTGEVIVQVERGTNASEIAAELFRKGVVKSAGAFRDVARDDERSLRIQPGYYRLRREMKAAVALDLFFDPKARLRSRYTIPEGTTVAVTLETIAKSVDGVALADLQEAAKNPAALGLPEYAKGRLEGFLFPATYDVEPFTPATDVLRAMVERFEEAAAEMDLEGRARALGRTPYDVLIVASLVEAETPKDAERGKVARVAYNRLLKRMPLGFDSTTQYALGKRKERLTSEDFAADGPYNTRKRAGLPPTPIGNPGEAALLAALEPEPGPWLYFVCVDTEGNSAFSESYDEFLRNKRRSTCPGVG